MLSVALSLSLAEARPAGRYPAPLFRGARTFLALLAQAAAARPSGGVGYRRVGSCFRVGSIKLLERLHQMRCAFRGLGMPLVLRGTAQEAIRVMDFTDAPKAPRNAIATVVLTIFVLLIIAGFVGFVAIFWENGKRERAEARIVLTIETSRSVRELRRCFNRKMHFGRQSYWAGGSKEPGGLRGFNSMTDVGARLHDLGTKRVVVITTRLARTLRPGEVETIRECTAPPEPTW